MRIPRVNLALPLCMLVVMVFLGYVIRHQENTIALQRIEIRSLAVYMEEQQMMLETPCEERRPTFQENKRNQTILAWKY